MTKAVSEDNLAALVNEVSSCLIAIVGLCNVLLEDYLLVGETESFLNSHSSIEEVLVVGGSLVVEKNEANLEILGNLEILLQIN